MIIDKRPIIIGGFYRSGTTLLRRLLDAHSQIHCPPEIKFFRDMQLDFQDDAYAHLRFFTTVRSLPVEIDDILDTLGQGYLSLRRKAAQTLGKAVWADKDPENALYLPYWQRLLPEGFRYIHLGRHPVDMLASAHEAAFVKTLPADPVQILERWKTCCQASKQFQLKFPAETRIIRYEDLVRNPESLLKKLFMWLGIDFEPEILTRFLDAERGTGIEDPKVISTGKIHNTSVGRGSHMFLADESTHLLTLCRSELEWLGYEASPSA